MTCRPNERSIAARPNRHGFTLIETIVVLVILGLALSIVAGFLPNRSSALDLSAATARVSNALRLARSQAMGQSRPVEFTVTPDGHGFALDNTPVSLRSAVVIVAEPRSIVFAPDGSASGGRLHVVLGNRERVIQVDWLTGRVMVAAP